MEISLGTYDVILAEHGLPEVQLDLDELIPISSDLNQEFIEQPSLYAHIAMLAAQAEAFWIDAKRHQEGVYAETDKEVRLDLLRDDEKITEGKVSAGVKLRRGYIEAQNYELDCREQYLIMRALERTMDMRAQMLISLGAHLRAEAQQTDMLIKQTKENMTSAHKKVSKARAKKGETPPF